MTDLFFVTVLFWLFAMHTRTADFVLDHAYVPTTDPFSFTKAWPPMDRSPMAERRGVRLAQSNSSA
jgi:hypothetical protein